MREPERNVAHRGLGLSRTETWEVCLSWWEVPGGVRALVVAQLWPWMTSLAGSEGRGSQPRDQGLARASQDITGSWSHPARPQKDYKRKLRQEIRAWY